ncbi:MAG: hypothetical protein MJ104_01055 [Lachnospiraceae bacterium]|nr:hypothetical protein [Lachnospiraceae bacterium]
MRDDILDTLGFIDDSLIEKAENYTPKSNKGSTSKSKIKYLAIGGSIAAALFLAVISISAIVALNSRNNGYGSNAFGPSANPYVQTITSGTTAQSQKIGFKLNGDRYHPITWDERLEYGLVLDEAAGQSVQNMYVITDDDIGSEMGVIKKSTKKALNGLTVYHFASREDDDSICIIEVNGAYAFYVRE